MSLVIIIMLCIPSGAVIFPIVDFHEIGVGSIQGIYPEIHEIPNDVVYIPENITPADASYHPSNDRFTIEWWYFEGIFDNGYNAVVNIILWSKNNLGICITHLNIFHESDPDEFFTTRTVQPISLFQGSTSYPNIHLNNDQLVDFDSYLYNSSGEWKYSVTVEIDGNAVDLEFFGRAPGWQGDTLGGSYGPVLPMADVRGKITLSGKTIEVAGLGYHEHAHGISFPVKESGWYWGKIVGETTSFFWGRMMNTVFEEQGRAGVFCKENSSFINIEPSSIIMKFLDYEFHKRRFIPTTFDFRISDPLNNIHINVTMTTEKIYHLPLGIFNYWRYLIKISGVIEYNSLREELHDETQIMEVMRFR